MKTSDFRILSDCIEKYKPALSKSTSSWDNSYCVRLVIISNSSYCVRLVIISNNSYCVRLVTKIN